ncbi:TMEM175 family protein [Xanthobacter sp. V3C-3]|uniref:TMEM175 family protein n=1 Tax=Xanthobacter lutulentifluminis TaxID=3119935 RepID=UPI00372A32EC
MSRFSKTRVEALTDGVFAFAMTLLVLDIRLPDDLDIRTAADLSAHLAGLWHQTLTYLISFFVLGAFWRTGAAVRPNDELVDGNVTRLTLFYLFFVTTVPFSSGLVGRYSEFTPAVLVYSANLAMLGVLAIALRYLDVKPGSRSLAAAAGSRLPLLLATAAGSALLGVVAPRQAMFVYLLNFLTRLPFWPGRGNDRQG